MMSAHDTLRHQLDASLVAVRNPETFERAKALLAEIRGVDDQIDDWMAADNIAVSLILAELLSAEARGITQGHAITSACYGRADAAE